MVKDGADGDTEQDYSYYNGIGMSRNTNALEDWHTDNPVFLSTGRFQGA